MRAASLQSQHCQQSPDRDQRAQRKCEEVVEYSFPLLRYRTASGSDRIRPLSLHHDSVINSIERRGTDPVSLWHVHLARDFTGGTPVPLSQTASVPSGAGIYDPVASTSPSGLPA